MHIPFRLAIRRAPFQYNDFMQMLMSVWRRLTIVIKKMVFVPTQWGITLVLVMLDILEVVSAALVRHNFDACRHGYLHL